MMGEVLRDAGRRGGVSPHSPAPVLGLAPVVAHIVWADDERDVPSAPTIVDRLDGHRAARWAAFQTLGSASGYHVLADTTAKLSVVAIAAINRGDVAEARTADHIDGDEPAPVGQFDDAAVACDVAGLGCALCDTGVCHGTYPTLCEGFVSGQDLRTPFAICVL